MVKKLPLFFALFAGLSVPSAVALAVTAWMGPTYDLPLAHVTHTGQVVSGALDLSLQHDTQCDVTIHTLRAGGEVLTHVPTGDTLTTTYMLTGPSLLTQDATWITSTDFKNRSYHVKTNGPANDVLHLAVQGEAPTGRAVPTGDYTTSFALTVTW